VALMLAVLTGIAFGVFAAVQAARHSTHESLKAGALNTSQSRGQHRLRGLLVVSEMAMSTTLLVGASLLVRSMIHLQTSDMGFDPERLYAVHAELPKSRYPTDAAKAAFQATLLERVRAMPGAAEVTHATNAPPSYRFNISALHIEGREEPADGESGLLRFTGVSPSFFRALRMPIVEGRVFADTTEASNELMVNQGFAKKHWPGESAVGKRLRMKGWGKTGPWRTIVGVVADASTGGLTNDRADPVMYTPHQMSDDVVVLVRARPGTEVLPALRAAVASLDPRLPPPTMTDIEAAMNDSIAMPRFTMMLLVGFTALALVLAAIGLYGVMSYGVAQRTREIGIRMALGASRRDVSRDVVTRGVALAAAGVFLGLVGSWWATKLIEKMLYGVSRTDPVAFGAGAVVLLATALLACIVPMNRAASVDPAIAMRAD
jgi:putative ABC transport system permease protein